MQNWLASAVASHHRVPPSTSRRWAASAFIIRYNLSIVVNRRLIGDGEGSSHILILILFLIEARRYEHAGCANHIHCR